MPEMTNYGKLVFLGENYKKGEYDRVYDYYTRMINNKTQKLAEVYNNRGVYYLEQKFYNKAIDDFQNAIKIAPQQKETYFNLALVYYSMEDYKEAKKNLDNYFELCKNNQDNYIVGNYGSTKFEDDNSRNTFISHVLKANIDLKLENFKEAFCIYDKYKINYFADLPLIEGKSYAFIDLNKYKKASKSLYNLLTAIYIDEGNLRTRGYYNRFLPKEEVWENAYIFSNLALVESLKGNSIKASEYITKAKTIAFNYNKIDLYVKVVKTYNLLNSNFNIHEL